MSGGPTLKPCPFCGRGQTDVKRLNEWHTELVHYCEPLNHPSPCNIIRLHGASAASVVEQWNRRPGCP
jgi:hypothetical protein